jgi:DNA repair protein RecO (recombination protein O)
MLIKTNGIVLKTRKFSETSIIADIFTEAKGLRTYIISGVRTQKSKVSAGLLQPMMLVDVVAYHRDDKDMTRLKEIKSLHVFHHIPFEIARSAVGMFIIEVAQKTIHGHEEHPELFQFLMDTFLFLDETSHSVANLHLHFMLSFTEYLGFLPGGHFSEETPFFDLEEGVFTSIQPSHANWLSEDLSEKLSRLIHLPREQSHEIQFKRDERKNFLKKLLDYYRLHIEHFPVIHSHEVLQEVFEN